VPHDINSPLGVFDVPKVDLSKSLLAMPCLAMHKVPEHLQWQCFSYVDPDRPELFVRAHIEDSGTYYLETEVDYNPRNPETFEDDVSFYVWPNRYFHGFYTYESVSMSGHFMRPTADGKMAVAYFQDNDEFRNAASWAVFDHSTRRTSVQTYYRMSSLKGVVNYNFFAIIFAIFLHELAPAYYISSKRDHSQQSNGVISIFLSVRPAVRPSVRPSVTRVNCDKTEERYVQIFIPYER